MLPIEYISSGTPPRQPFTSIFSFPQYFPQFSHYLSKDNWRYSFSYVGLYPSKGKWRYFLSYVDGISFRMLVVTPVRVIDSISFRMLVVTPIRVIDSISFSTRWFKVFFWIPVTEKLKEGHLSYPNFWPNMSLIRVVRPYVHTPSDPDRSLIFSEKFGREVF